MAFRKITNSKSDAMYIIGSRDNNRYPVGFEYRIGRTIYTVREDVTKDAGSEMRRVITSDGSTEIMSLESIDLDLKEPDCQILNDGLSEEEPEPQEEVEEPKQEEPKQEEEKKEYDGLDW